MSSQEDSEAAGVANDTAPDTSLINYVCDTLLPNHSLNRDLLLSWKTDLSTNDALELSLVVEQDLVVAFPSRHVSTPTIAPIDGLLSRLHKLEDSLYLDLKLVVLELVLYVASASYTARTRWFKASAARHLMDSLLQMLPEAQLLDLDYLNPLVLTQHLRLLVVFLELGCDVTELRRLLLPLLRPETPPVYRLVLLELLDRVFDAIPTHFGFYTFNDFLQSPVSVPFLRELLSMKALTVQSWFKVCSPGGFEDEANTATLFVLANSADDKAAVLKIVLINNSQFMVVVSNPATGSRMQFSFNQILSNTSRNQGFVHFALTFDRYNNLNLYIDGDYSESIPCPEVKKVLASWNKVYIGADTTNPATAAFTSELIIRNLTVLNVALPHEWISLLFNLGLSYNWNFKDFNDDNLLTLLNHLSPRALTNFSLKVSGLRTRKRLQDRKSPASESRATSPTEGLLATSTQKSELVNFLSAHKIQQSNVVFDTNDHSFSELFGTSSKVLFHNSKSIYDALYSTGGTLLLLNNVESASISDLPDKQLRDTILYKSLTMLLLVLQNDWRLNKEFENLNGYGLFLIIFTCYKDNHNKSLAFDLLPQFFCASKAGDISTLSKSDKNNLLNVFLSYCGYDFTNPYESLIINPLAYRFTILNFELYLGSADFNFLLYHFQVLIVGSKFSELNTLEITRMKLLKKVVQFLKSPFIIDHKVSDEGLEQLSFTLNYMIKSDTSVEAIRSISLFIIYSLYHSSQEGTAEYGTLALRSLTEVLCDPNTSIKVLKKFSRSITIHWILLLFNYKSYKGSDENVLKNVVKCGLTLLTKLLKVLGSFIIKRFFQVNHGLDILTHFLKDWWHDDQILSLIFLSAFGFDTLEVEKERLTLTSILSSESYLEKLSTLIMPDFLILLNNLVLSSMITLSLKHGKVLSAQSSPAKSKLNSYSHDEDIELSLNVLHLVNQYSESIRLGFEKVKGLEAFYSKPEWLEGVFELLGDMRLTLIWVDAELKHNFTCAYEKLVDVLSGIFVSKLLTSKEIFKMMENLSDITKKLIVETVFPKCFQHINQFITVSNFIFNEKEFTEGSCSLLNFYHSELIKQNYEVSTDDIQIYSTCALSILETVESNKSTLPSDHKKLERLKNGLGDVILLSFLKLSEEYSSDWVDLEVDEEARNNGLFGTKLNEKVKLLLYRQIIILQPEVLNDQRLSSLINVILGNYFRLDHETQITKSEYIFNFLRTCFMMRQDNFGNVINRLCAKSEYNNSPQMVSDFFNFLVTKNDEETFKSIQRQPTVKNIFIKNFHSQLGAFKEEATLNVSDMVGVMLNNGGKLSFMNNIYIKSFEKDCEQLKVLIVNGELIKFNRAVQDRQENILFFVNGYNSAKIEVERLVSLKDTGLKRLYVLDFIENVDRMRKRLIVEDQLADSEKLSYNIDIPIKNIDPIDVDLSSFENYDYAIARNSINTLSLSQDPFLDLGQENFELVDGPTESSETEETTTTYEDKNRKVIRSLFVGDQIVALWNVSEINGLAPIESLMILGSDHLYLIENYFHCADGNVIDAQDAPVELRDPYLQLINSQSLNYMKNDVNGSKSHKSKTWGLERLSCISKRQFLLRDIAIEMFFSDGASILITCLSTKERDAIYSRLHPNATGKGLDSDLAQILQLSSTSLASSGSISNGATSFLTSKLAALASGTNSTALTAATKKWRMGEMSNLYYLMLINTLAGRTFNDLTQYPVFPWVIADYTSDKLDFSNPKTFRDLSKPMGGQTNPRAQQFRERYDALNSLQDHNSPPFHYGTHYSSAMIVTLFLIRMKPYVQSYLLLQGGKFDHADRLFNSVEKAWVSASKDNTTDVRELTPEFFYLPEFLVNSNNFEFGTLQNGEAPNDVILPPWAHGDPKIFIAKNREALESSYVSANLHLWIDLIFGYKQNGPEAVESLNVFHHLSYNGAINLDNINDDVEKRAVIGMINNFGQTPMKIFHRPHAAKEVLNLANFYLMLIDKSQPPKLVFESKLKLPIEKLEISTKSRKWVGRPSCISSEDDLLIRKSSQHHSAACGSLIVNETSFLNIHLANITCVLQIGNKQFLTGSEDGIIHVWQCNVKHGLSLQFQSTLRGHLAAIRLLRFSKTFKVCLSVDADGVVMVWDLTRFKFMRKITSTTEARKVLAAVSNDTGNFATVHSTKYSNVLTIYTINGEVVLETKLRPGHVTGLSIASTNDSMVCSDKHPVANDHSFWLNEVVAVAYSSPDKVVELFEVVSGEGWGLEELDRLKMADCDVPGAITALEVFKKTEVDTEERLCRGNLVLVFGDSTGRVYTWK